jgi:hypothetical protein
MGCGLRLGIPHDIYENLLSFGSVDIFPKAPANARLIASPLLWARRAGEPFKAIAPC